MRGAVLVGLIVVVSGCVTAAPKTAPGVSVGPEVAAPDNSTLEGVLLNSPHLKIVGTATLSWELSNATAERPAVQATLVKIADAFKSSHVGMTGPLRLVAIVPVEGFDSVSACGAQPKAVRSYFEPRDTLQQGLANLTGEYPAGWYHFVMVATGSATFTVSFETKKEVKARTLPAKDPYVTAEFVTAAGSREPSHSVEKKGDVWFAWATTTVGSALTDGGRELSVDIGGCQSAKSSGTSSRTSKAGANAHAMGDQSSTTVKGAYKPTVSTLAPASATLNIGAISIRHPTVDAPAATGPS